MVKEAAAHATEDKNKRDQVEAHNEGDGAAYQAEKFLRESGDKIPADKKTELEGKIKDVRAAIIGTDTEAMRRETEALKTLFGSIGAAMYQQTEPTPGDAPPAGEKPNDGDDVVEGEFREQK